MTIVVNVTSSAVWTRTAGQICRDALEHLAVYGASETMTAEDQNKALRALDAVLKELPLSGYLWPKLSAETALEWDGTEPGTVALPEDYFNYASVSHLVDGKTVPLAQIPHAQWIAKADRTLTGTPTHFYVAPDRTLHYWPVPESDPQASLQYLRIIEDSAATVVPDVLQHWVNALGWGVADELSLDYGLPGADRMEINQRWNSKRTKALAYSLQFEPITFGVA